MSDQYPNGPYGQQQDGQQQYGGAPACGAQSGGEPPLWAPWYGISFPKAFVRFWKKYVRFDGRASRSEYWWWILWTFLIGIVLSIVDGLIAAATGTTTTQSSAGYFGFRTMSSSPMSTLASNLWALAALLPNIALLMRRLHDGNHSGWWWLLAFIPIVGWIVILVLVLQPSRSEGQRFDRPDSV